MLSIEEAENILSANMYDLFRDFSNIKIARLFDYENIISEMNSGSGVDMWQGEFCIAIFSRFFSQERAELNDYKLERKLDGAKDLHVDRFNRYSCIYGNYKKKTDSYAMATIFVYFGEIFDDFKNKRSAIKFIENNFDVICSQMKLEFSFSLNLFDTERELKKDKKKIMATLRNDPSIWFGTKFY